MNTTQRITISMPIYLYELLLRQVKPGNISKFVSHAVEKELQEPITNPVADFIQLREKLPKLPSQAIINAIQKDRT